MTWENSHENAFLPTIFNEKHAPGIGLFLFISERANVRQVPSAVHQAHGTGADNIPCHADTIPQPPRPQGRDFAQAYITTVFEGKALY